VKLKFVKMHGAGNDFIVVDGTTENIIEDDLPELSKRICDRHFGVGGDGLIIVLHSNVADFRMRIFNPDGSEAEMCGNGVRVFAKYIYDRKMHKDVVMTVETLAGIKTLEINATGDKAKTVRVDMGEPKLLRFEIPMRGKPDVKVIGEPLRVAGKRIEITCVSMGNPHCVVFVDDVDHYPVGKMGPLIENHPKFPARTNVEFVEVINPHEIKVRTWERGVGETLACGTGACASVVAGSLNGKTLRKVTVHLRGGDLNIEWADNNRLLMTGPAEEVFEGKLSAST
jgi:diaminopimelate epimerase